MVDNSRLEVLLRHDRWIVCAGLVIMTGLAWAYLLGGAGMDMSKMDMITGAWSPAYWTIVFLMWWIMMIAMMVPGATPVILLYTRVVRHSQKNIQPNNIAILTMAFVAGYLVSWAGFSAIVTLLQWGMEQINWLSMNMVSNKSWLSGSLLIAVGIYQLTPLKSACLKKCRSPAEFIADHMKSGVPGALQMGFEHGIFCVGCCWLLMFLLFVGGVMNLLWIVFLTFIVLAEKILPHGESVSAFTGYVLIVWGAFILIFPLV